MMKISFNHPLPDVSIYIIFIVTVYIIYYLYRKLKMRQRMLFFILNTLTAVIILSMIFRPELSIKTVSRVQEDLCILIDSSLSMGIQDRKKNITRLEKVKKFIASNQMLKKYKLSLYAFGDAAKKIEEKKDIAGIIPQQNTSFIFDAVSQIDEMAGKDFKGIILFTDGQESKIIKPEQIKRGFDTPVFTIDVGENPPADISITDIISNSPVYTGESLHFAVYLKQSGFDNRKAKIILKEASRVLKEKEIIFTGDVGTVEFEIEPPSQGEKVYEVEVSAGDESIKENNIMDVFARVISPRIKVLYIEGSLKWEYRFLKRYIESSPNFSSVFLIKVGENFHLHQTGKEEVKISNDIFNSKFLDGFHIILLGDINFSTFSAEQLKNLYNFVYNKRKSLLLLGGENFADGLKYTPVAEIIPFSPTGTEKGIINKRFLPSITEESRALSIFVNPENPFPPLDRINNVTLLKPSSVPLLTAEDIRPPLVLAGINTTLTGGKCIFIGTDSTWKWSFGGEEEKKSYDFFWGRILRHMCTPADYIGIGTTLPEIITERKSCGTGENVHLQFIYKTAPHSSPPPSKKESKGEYEKTVEIPYKKIEAFLTTPDGKEIPLETKTPETSFVAEKEGLYKVFVAGEDRKNVKEVFVSKNGNEFRDINRNEVFLKYIAESSGGVYIPFEDVEQLDGILKKARKFTTRKVSITRDSIRYLVPLVFIILNFAWFLRRRSGIL
jgi:hypothetical protein